MVAQAFTWGTNGKKLSPEEARSRQKIADALMTQNTAPKTFGEGLSRVGDALLAIRYGKDAEEAQTAGGASADAIFNSLVGNPDPGMSDLYQAASDPWVSDKYGPIINAMMGQEQQQAQWARQDALLADERAQPDFQTFESGGDQYRFNANDPSSSPELWFDAPVAPAAPDYGFVELPGGQIVRTDGNTGNVQDMGQFGAPGGEQTDTQVNLQWRAEQAGLQPGTPEYQQFMMTGGTGGTSLSVGPDGTVQFSQGGGKPLTEGQAKDTVFATRATNALPTIDQFEKSLLSLPENLAGGVPVLGNFMQSEDYQVARDAGREFLASILRKDTGAAVTASEEQMYGDMFLPRPGDKPQTIEMKRQRRALAVEAIKAGMPQQALDNMLTALTTAGNPGGAGGPASEPAGPAAPAMSTPAGPQSQPQAVSSQQQYDALPPGSPYLAPDGTIRTKGQ